MVMRGIFVIIIIIIIFCCISSEASSQLKTKYSSLKLWNVI